MYYWGFDLGDGESAIARTGETGQATPEIMDVEGNKVFITAWALMKNGEVRIGERAAKSAAAAMRSAARFKSRFLDPQSDSGGLIRDFAARALESLRAGGLLKGGESGNRFYIGCPAGWDAAARQRYQTIFETLGCPDPHIVSESRAVMVGSVQSNSLRDYVDLRAKTILVVDIGSSTTDFAYIRKGKEAEIRTGGEVFLGGGIMDEVLLERCVAAAPRAEAIRRVFAESEAWRVDCELKARKLKERYFSAGDEERERTEFSESLLIRYDEPLVLELKMDEKMADVLTDKPCAPLGGRSFREVFCAGLREVRQSIGQDLPELLFLTGGVSRMAAVRDWCAQVFPEAVIYTDGEPEFSVARGLSWCGRIDDELSRFREEVEKLIGSDTVERIVSEHLTELYRSALDQLLDPLLERTVKPVLVDWRDGKIGTLAEMAPILQEKIKVYLYSEEARNYLHRPVEEWMYKVSEDLEKQTSPICRRYRVPDHSLEISSRLEASDLRILKEIRAESVFPDDALTGAAVLVESVVSVVVALLCGGSGVALISEGPMGIIIGLILSLLLLIVGHLLGKKTVDEKLMEARLPLLVRRATLTRPLPRLEAQELNLPNPLKLLKRTEEGQDGEKSENGGAGFKLHLLPRLSRGDEKEIAPWRMNRIRSKVLAGYEDLLADKENPEVKALNERMSREISEQIEQRLKTLAEQVEIPL